MLSDCAPRMLAKAHLITMIALGSVLHFAIVVRTSWACQPRLVFMPLLH